MFDDRIIEQVIELWGETRGEAYPLSFDHVRTIMETVFFSGLKREEDRPVHVSVSLVDPDEFPRTAARAGENVVLHLERTLPFNVDAMVKLAPAFDPSTTSMAVWPVAEGGDELEIWGAVFTTARGRNRFDPLPVILSPPDVLTIACKKPGALTLFRGNNVIARFTAGQFHEPTPAPFTSSLMGWSLLKTVKNHHGFHRFGTKYWRTYRDFIDRLLVEANNRGHGGIIIWVPEENLPHAHSWIAQKHILRDGPEGASLLEQLCDMDLQRVARLRHEGQIPTAFGSMRAMEEGILECKRHILEHVELLAKLMHVDGALILSDQLRPLSFGSVLVAPLWQGRTIYGPDTNSYPSVQVDLTRYGTRHNSAVNMIGKSPDSVAFVISQDGPISGLTRMDEETVYWWPDCLSKLWTV